MLIGLGKSRLFVKFSGQFHPYTCKVGVGKCLILSNLMQEKNEEKEVKCQRKKTNIELDIEKESKVMSGW